jgi:hypothetical protein
MTTLGTSGNDFFAGNSGFDDYLALDGDDTIFGNEGGDNLNGNQNNDVVVGGPGNDTARGGQDNDQVFGNEGDDLLFGDRGSDTIVAGEGNDTVLGGNGINVTDADNENDLIFGNTGNDVLFGDRGADTIYGGQDNDTIYGGQENDEIFGDLGDDWLYGDKGSDSLTGGDGSDRFTLGNGIGGPTLDDADWFLDFVSGQDTLQLLGDLTFDQLNIFQGTGDFANHTIIQQNVTGEFLAILRDVDATTITGQPASPPAPPPPPAVTDPNTFPNVPPPPDVTPGDPPPVVPPPPPPPGSISLAPGVTPQEAGPVAGTFVLSRGGETTQALTVNYTVGGTATPGTDYTELSGTATFGVGESQAIIEVPTLDDTDVDGGETIEVTIAAPTGLTIAGDATQSLTILDNESSSISIAAGATPQEAEQVAGTFVLSRAGDASQALTVNYTVGGTATAGTDYTELSGTASFAAGSSQAVITVPTLDDTDVDPDETVEVTVTAPTGLTIEGNATQSLTILDNEPTQPPTISIAPQSVGAEKDPLATGQPLNGQFVLTRTGDLTNELTVNYTVAGTATAGTDFTDIGTTATFAAGQAQTTIDVPILDDGDIDPSETVIVTLADPPAAGVALDAANSTATLQIVDDDLPSVTVTASATAPQEYDAAAGAPVASTFTVSRTGDTTNALTIPYAVSGTATSGTDYTALGSEIVIPAGATTADITLTPIRDAETDPNETVTVTLAAPSGFMVQGDPATLTIQDEELTVAIAADATVPTEGTYENPAVGGDEVPGTFTLTRTGDPAAALTVPYTVAGTAIAGVDFAPLTGNATFAAGAATTTITLTPIDDGDVDPSETVEVTIAPPAPYGVAGAPTQTLTITDNEPPEVSVIAGIAPSEAGPTDGNFIFTRTPSEAATTVNYTVAGTATAGDDYTALAGSVTIPASATNTTVQVAVPALDDLVGEGDETIEVTLTADPAAYTIATGVAILTLADNDGTAGADNLAGSTGDDIIAGGAGDDVINGNSGNDVLVGEAGNDDLTGGDGADLFRFNATTEGTDTIQDFVVGTDKIQATTGAFGAIPVGALPVANFVTGAAATAAAPQFIYNAGALSFDADGTGAGVPVLLANLTGAPVLTATDIEIV